ncbi:Nre family DNA repair protein [Halococcus dombrowskii]|uniref:DNA repair protein n=1 Tax=Halococcus dombrowskii TaxID=179637 RepID=A0AAV3SFB1_HALDO|nr:DNA repair protein NreA [Halococcus dombrowskii]UOO95053.1 Nre family DNA repair protein [Halococcus dombrowskii]
MQLDEYFEEIERDERDERRQLAAEKSYAITDYLDDVETNFERRVSDDALLGSTSPTIFVGRSSYPNVSTGVLSPVGHEERAADFETGGHWYDRDFSIEDVFQHRTGLVNTAKTTSVTNVADAWNGFLGTQREVAIADRPVDVEIGLDSSLDVDFSVSAGDVTSPTGPRARAESATLTENPHVPRPVKKTLEDDDWRAEGAMNYLYNRGFDVYDINTILSAGALGEGENRRLVPTRWSITAVDDTVGQFLRGQIRNATAVDKPELFYNEYLGNKFWILLTPGQWEFELVECKAPGSVWNPAPERGMMLAADREGHEGRTSYVDETAGAYYAARLGVLEQLVERGRQASVLVVRHVTPDYWGPTGVWQVRESVRNAFDGESGTAESFGDALRQLEPQLPISLARLRRKSSLAAGVQSSLSAFGN